MSALSLNSYWIGLEHFNLTAIFQVNLGWLVVPLIIKSSLS